MNLFKHKLDFTVAMVTNIHPCSSLFRSTAVAPQEDLGLWPHTHTRTHAQFPVIATVAVQSSACWLLLSNGWFGARGRRQHFSVLFFKLKLLEANLESKVWKYTCSIPTTLFYSTVSLLLLMLEVLRLKTDENFDGNICAHGRRWSFSSSTDSQLTEADEEL